MVRAGEDFKHPAGHGRFIVYGEMLIQIGRDYGGIDPRTLKAHEMRFLYNGLRSELKAATKPRMK